MKRLLGFLLGLFIFGAVIAILLVFALLEAILGLIEVFGKGLECGGSGIRRWVKSRRDFLNLEFDDIDVEY